MTIEIPKQFIITIDGPSASGKSSVSKLLAQKLKANFLPTGKIYRAFALKLHDLNIDYYKLADFPEAKLQKIASSIELNDLAKLDLNNEKIAAIASITSEIEIVRKVLLKLQKDFAKKHDQVILEGRDCGTVIAPEADLKIYLSTSVETRAKRRFEEIKSSELPLKQQYDEILRKIIERDERDLNRKCSPLKPAKDSIEIDSGDLSVEEISEKIINLLTLQ